MRDAIDTRVVAVRSALILTASYVNGTVITDAWKHRQLIVLLQVTLGSLTSAELRIEFSPDNTTWFQEVIDAANSLSQFTTSQGDRTFTASGNYRVAIPIADNFIRIAVKGTGTTTDSSCTVDAKLSR